MSSPNIAAARNALHNRRRAAIGLTLALCGLASGYAVRAPGEASAAAYSPLPALHISGILGARNPPKPARHPSASDRTGRSDAGHPGNTRPEALTDLFILISVDGLRPDVVLPHARNIQRLSNQGASAIRSRTVSKATTLPSHAAMVSGVDAKQHGLDFNSYRPERGAIRFPTIFSAARDAGLGADLFVGKRKLEHLLQREAHDAFRVGGAFCSKVTKLAVPHIAKATAGVVFVHFADPDSAGHRHGWLSKPYMAAVKRADNCVGDIISAARQRSDLRVTLLVTSDHGGHDHNHGSRLRDDRRIPWIIWGSGVRKTRIRRLVPNTDTAATILKALGLPEPANMTGKPVFEALEAVEI